MRLALPHQAFTFSYSEINLLDDPPLAAAFAVSLRTAFAEVPDVLHGMSARRDKGAFGSGREPEGTGGTLGNRVPPPQGATMPQRRLRMPCIPPVQLLLARAASAAGPGAAGPFCLIPSPCPSRPPVRTVSPNVCVHALPRPGGALPGQHRARGPPTPPLRAVLSRLQTVGARPQTSPAEAVTEPGQPALPCPALPWRGSAAPCLSCSIAPNPKHS